VKVIHQSKATTLIPSVGFNICGESPYQQQASKSEEREE
jgi:hypothetical protein